MIGFGERGMIRLRSAFLGVALAGLCALAFSAAGLNAQAQTLIPLPPLDANEMDDGQTGSSGALGDPGADLRVLPQQQRQGGADQEPEVQTNAEREAPSVRDPYVLRGDPRMEAERGAAWRFLPLEGNLPDDNREVLLEQQEAERRFTVTLPAEAVVADSRIFIRYLNSIEVLPAASRLDVAVNGRLVASFAPRAVSGAQDIRADLPEGLFRPGPNEVVIRARQNHRVLCSINGIYELWSAVDALASGIEVRLAQPLAPPSLASFDYALASGINGPRRLTLLAPSNSPDEEWVADALELVQGAARRVPGDLPDFQLVSLESLERAGLPATALPVFDRDALPGGMLALFGTANELSGMVPHEIMSFVSGPYVGVHNLGRGDGSAVLIFSGQNREEVSDAIAAWVSQELELPARSNAVISDLSPALERPGPPREPIQGGEAVTLGQLGTPETEVGGLRRSIKAELLLPDDFFAANDDAVTLKLNASYAPGLHRNSALNIFVNGTGSALIGLNDPQGEVMDDRLINLPLRNFKPGVNEIEFEVSLPALNADNLGFCPPGTINIDQPPRFVLHPDTELTFPSYARLGHLPDLDLFVKRGFPYVNNGQPVLSDLYIAVRDLQTINSALVVAAAVARQADDRLRLRPTFSYPDMSSRNLLAVGPTNNLRPTVFANAPLRQQDIVTAWSYHRPIDPMVSDEREIAATTATESLLQRIEAMRSGVPQERFVAQSFEEDHEAEESVPRESWRRGSHEQEGSERSWYHRLVSLLPALAQGMQAEQAAQRFLSGSSGDVTAVMMQYEAHSTPGRTVTLITALDSRLLLAGVKRLVQPDYWVSLKGDLAVWGPQPQTLGTGAVGQPYTVMPPTTSLGNLRLILSNWLSRNVLALLVSTGMIVFLLSAVTYMLLRMDRRRRDLG